jgi:inward rectifier potassium channel
MGDGVNIVAAIEAMTGSCLCSGDWSNLQTICQTASAIAFSDHALIAPFQDKTGLMFRIASYKDIHNLTDVEIKVNLALQVQENGNASYKFYSLGLERNKVDTLMMNWTVVHPIDENSPLLDLSEEELRVADVEVYVQVRGFDDVYSTTVIQRTSYTYDEIIFNAKFVTMYHESEDGKTTILELDKLSTYYKL